jgi:hypothetical protein
MNPMFSFPNNAFKHSIALTLNVFHIYFRLKCNVLHRHISSTLHGLAVHDHHQVPSILPKLLHCISKLRIACERIFPDKNKLTVIKTNKLTSQCFPYGLRSPFSSRLNRSQLPQYYDRIGIIIFHCRS